MSYPRGKGSVIWVSPRNKVYAWINHPNVNHSDLLLEVAKGNYAGQHRKAFRRGWVRAGTWTGYGSNWSEFYISGRVDRIAVVRHLLRKYSQGMEVVTEVKE